MSEMGKMKMVSEDSIEAMADNINYVANAFKKMNDRLTRNAIIVLIQEAATVKISKSDIGYVLTGIERLDTLVKAPAKKKQ